MGFYVHVLGGTISVAAAYIMGPRIGRFNEDNSESLELKGHSVPFTALGGFILMFGFLVTNGFGKKYCDLLGLQRRFDRSDFARRHGQHSGLGHDKHNSLWLLRSPDLSVHFLRPSRQIESASINQRSSSR